MRSITLKEFLASLKTPLTLVMMLPKLLTPLFLLLISPTRETLILLKSLENWPKLAAGIGRGSGGTNQLATAIQIKVGSTRIIHGFVTQESESQ